MDNIFKDFENSINFIAPKIIPSEDEKNAYMNLKSEPPNAKKNKISNKNSSLSGQDSSSLNICDNIDSNKNSSENSPDTFSSDFLKDNNLQDNIIKKDPSSKKNPDTQKIIKVRDKKIWTARKF